MKFLNIFSKFFKHTEAGQTPTPHLSRRPEFEQALQGYKPSAGTIKTLAQTPLATLTAPTATGRNTIINELIKTGRYHFIVSDTTRPPRMNKGVWEQNGREYFFKAEDEMLDEIKKGKFIEAEVIHKQQVSGISVREIERAQKEGRIAIADVDIEGGINIAKLKPDAMTICLLPPSFDEWMSRMHGRSNFEPEEVLRRLQQAKKVFKLALENKNFIFVVNDKLDEAIRAVDAVIADGAHDEAAEKSARKLAAKLYEDTVRYLQKHSDLGH